jgi:hypothetical protein
VKDGQYVLAISAAAAAAAAAAAIVRDSCCRLGVELHCWLQQPVFRKTHLAPSAVAAQVLTWHH